MDGLPEMSEAIVSECDITFELYCKLAAAQYKHCYYLVPPQSILTKQM